MDREVSIVRVADSQGHFRYNKATDKPEPTEEVVMEVDEKSWEDFAQWCEEEKGYGASMLDDIKSVYNEFLSEVF